MARTLLAAALLVACACATPLPPPAQAFTLSASLTPDVLGAPTNLSTTMTLAEGDGVPEPVSGVVAYGPAGLKLEVSGLATCERTNLEVEGTRGCPAESRVGFGGGVGLVDLGATTVKESYTLDFFLAPREHGHLRILVYVDAVRPIPVELVLIAREVPASSPYGFGLAVEVPPIPTVPGGANVSVESSYVSLGASNVAYYRTVHDKRELVHVRGLIAPARCPRAGFPFETTVTFEDRTTSTGKYLAACPGGHR